MSEVRVVVPAAVLVVDGSHAGVLSSIHHSCGSSRYGEVHLERTLPVGGVLSPFWGDV